MPRAMHATTKLDQSSITQPTQPSVAPTEALA
jgi:hypothetical protein